MSLSEFEQLIDRFARWLFDRSVVGYVLICMVFVFTTQMLQILPQIARLS